MMSLRADLVGSIRIENYQVGIATGGNRSLARIEPEQFGRHRGNQLHKAIHAEAALGDSAGIDQAHAMLDSRTSVGNLGEVIFSPFLLFFEAEGAMIGGNYLQMIAFETVP